MNSYSALKENFDYFVENNVNFLHAQGQSWNRQCTEWNDLKTYLNASLAWDHTQDMDKMIDKFFINFYMDAAPHMRDGSMITVPGILYKRACEAGTIGVQAREGRLWMQRFIPITS